MKKSLIAKYATNPANKQPDTSASLFSVKAFKAERDLPIVYCDNYNISLLGLELTHSFDTKKYRKIAERLNVDFLDTPWCRNRHFDEPAEADEQAEGPNGPRKLRYLKPIRPVGKQELALHHTEEYIEHVHDDKSIVARVAEVWLLNLVPLNLIETRILTPVKWQIAGTIYAAHLAMQHGWAINLGGGFHQSSVAHGETFCFFSDVMLAMKYIWRKHPLQNFMIIDLDAHQAIGLERDLTELEEKYRRKVYMLDMFNNSVQPGDELADKGCDLRVELRRFTGDKTYLSKLESSLSEAFSKFKPTLIIYVAGQDVLEADRLGLMNLSDEALMKRDELVFEWSSEKLKCPIVMLLGGGYLVRGAKVQADSIRNLYAKGLIWGGYRSGSRSLSRPRANKHHSEEPTRGSNESDTVSKKSVKSKSIKRAPLSKKSAKATEHYSFKKLG